MNEAAKVATVYRMVMKDHVCPYGIKTVDLLEREGFTVEDNHLATREQTDAFKARHGVDTTPQTFIGGKLTDPEWADYHMPLQGIYETPWAMAVKHGEDNLKKFMEDLTKEWIKSGRIVELEKKWGVPPTDYAKRLHEAAKKGS